MYVTKLSASRINTFIRCPFQYFLSYEVYVCKDCNQPTYKSEMQIMGGKHKCLNPYCGSTNLVKLDLGTNWGAIDGSCKHKVLELYANACKEGVNDWRLNWKDNLINAYFGILDNFETPMETFDLMFAKHSDIIEDQCDECKLNCLCKSKALKFCPYNVIQKSIKMTGEVIDRYNDAYRSKCVDTEKEFNIRLKDNIWVTGYMDLILAEDNDTIEIIDYKSGSWTKNVRQLTKDLQAQIYYMAACNEFPDKNVLVTFDYFQNYPATITFDEKHNKYLKKKLISIYHKIQDTHYPIRLSLNNNGLLHSSCKYLCNRNICDRQWEIFQQRYGKWGM